MTGLREDCQRTGRKTDYGFGDRQCRRCRNRSQCNLLFLTLHYAGLAETGTKFEHCGDPSLEGERLSVVGRRPGYGVKDPDVCQQLLAREAIRGAAFERIGPGLEVQAHRIHMFIPAALSCPIGAAINET